MEKELEDFVDNSYEILITQQQFNNISDLLDNMGVRFIPFSSYYPSHIFKPSVAEQFQEDIVLNLFVDKYIDIICEKVLVNTDPEYDDSIFNEGISEHISEGYGETYDIFNIFEELILEETSDGVVKLKHYDNIEDFENKLMERIYEDFKIVIEMFEDMEDDEEYYYIEGTEFLEEQVFEGQIKKDEYMRDKILDIVREMLSEIKEVLNENDEPQTFDPNDLEDDNNGDSLDW